MTDVDGGEASCKGYGLEVLSLLDSRDDIVSISMQHALLSFSIEFPVNKWDGSEMGGSQCASFNGVEGSILLGPET